MLRKLAVAWVLVLALAASAQAKEGGLLILVDLSGSAAHLASAPLAARMGSYTAKLIEDMPLGARVSLRTFGLADATQNWLALDYRLIRRPGGRPREIAAKVNLILANLPKLVAGKKLALQKSTHLLRALQDLAGHACSKGGTLLIVSDMMEYSPDANCYELVKSKQGSLPAPPGSLLEGVKVIAVGAGHGLATVEQNRRLKAMWSEWFQRAGAVNFEYLARL